MHTLTSTDSTLWLKKMKMLRSRVRVAPMICYTHTRTVPTAISALKVPQLQSEHITRFVADRLINYPRIALIMNVRYVPQTLSTKIMFTVFHFRGDMRA